jgi:hypothetical protein
MLPLVGGVSTKLHISIEFNPLMLFTKKLPKPLFCRKK